MSSVIGEIKGVKDGMEIEWNISDFFNLSEEKNKSYISPIFHFADASWYIRLYPNGHESKNSIGSIDCYLIKTDTSHSVTLQYELGLKNDDGNLDKQCRATHTYPEKKDGRGCTHIISRKKLLERKSDLAPSNVVTITCKLTRTGQRIISSLPFLKNEKLSNDMRKLMLNGNGSDLTIKIGSKEFKVHKNILEIRSLNFASMIKKEMEKNSVDIIDINDCEEDVFQMFLEYIYTGTVDGELFQENILKLYEIAQKYEITELKEECVKRVKDNLSVDTFFEAVEFSEKYYEKDLELTILNFVTENLKDLVKDSTWLTFMRTNTEKAYEFLSIALNNYAKS